MTLSHVGDKGGAVGILAFATAITAGSHPGFLKAFGKGLKAQHQIVNHGSVVLSETGKHA